MHFLKSIVAVSYKHTMQVSALSRRLLRSVKNLRWRREISSNAIITDENTVRSSIPDVVVSTRRLMDVVFEGLMLYPNHVALESAETKKSYTFVQLQKFTSNFATSLLKKLLLLPGDMVAIAMPNCPEFAVVTFGTIQAGCVLTTVNPAYQEGEFAHQFSMTKPKIVVTIPESHQTIRNVLNMTQTQAKIIIIDNPGSPVPDGTVRYSEMAELADTDFSLLEKIEKRPGDTAFVPFSSGTTGLPKGVEITHRNLVASLEIMRLHRVCLADRPHGNFQDVVPCVLPFFHIYGLVVLLIAHLSLGSRLITMKSFQSDLYFDVLKREKVSLLYMVPPLAILLARHPRVTNEYFQHLKYAFSGGAPLAGSDIEAFLQKTNPRTEFLQGFAATETSSAAVFVYKGSTGYKYGSSGDPMPNLHLKFIDPESGKPVPIGQPGEVYLKGPNIMKGYYKNEKATKDSLTSDGYYKTGDYGVYTLDQGLFITDRIKELIKVKGMQVAPAELEGILRTHPSIQDAAVIGMPHDFYGEIPKAFIVLNNKIKITEKEIKNFVSEKVSEYKRLHDVVFVDVIPKNSSGKILRRDLRKMI